MSTPTLTLTERPLLAGLHGSALGAGDLATATRIEVQRVLRERKGSQLEALRIGIGRLSESGWISGREAGELVEAVEAVFRAGRKKNGSAARAALRVREIYLRLTADPDVTPPALAIASLANEAFAPRPSGRNGESRREQDEDSARLEIEITPGNAATGAVVGGVIGAIVGGIAGGGIGAGIGAAVGGAVGGAIGACND